MKDGRALDFLLRIFRIWLRIFAAHFATKNAPFCISHAKASEAHLKRCGTIVSAKVMP
jgi:hypothetical protein